MEHTHVLLEPSLLAKDREALLRLIPAADHPGVVGDGDHERTDVEVALLCAGVDLQRGAARARLVDAHAVVHDPFEDGQRSDPHNLTVVLEHATALADAIETALPRWMGRVAPGIDPAPIVAEVMPRVRSLLAADIDEQTTTPIAVVRDVAVPMLTSALRAAGTPASEVERDEFARTRFPDDVYGLTPSSWADIDESLVSPGIAWGAAKAFVHKQRRSA